MLFRKVHELYSPGTASPQEDRKFVRNVPGCLFACVSDGVSGPYVGTPDYYGGATGGQRMAEAVVIPTIEASPAIDSAMTILERANLIALSFLKYYGIPCDPDKSPGACVDVVKITHESVEVCHIGDTFTIVEFRDGDIFATRNQVFAHDQEMNALFAQYRAQCGGDRKEAWKIFAPQLAAKRRLRVNQMVPEGYGLLNGSLNPDMVQRLTFPTKIVRRVFMATDGAMPYAQSGDSWAFARKFIDLYNKGGFEEILRYTRADEATLKHESHVDEAEAALICIEL